MQPDMNQIMRNMAKMQTEMKKIQDELQSTAIEGVAGGGAVTVTCTADLEFSAIKIKPEAVDPEDIGTLEDLVLMAIKDACEKAKVMSQQKMGKSLGGLMPPGMGF